MNKIHTDRILVIGGGISGLTTAELLADAGKSVTLVEKQAELGGLLRSIDGYNALARDKAEKVTQHELIEVKLETEPIEIKSFKGDFEVHLAHYELMTKESFSNIVFATGAECKFPKEIFASGASEKAITLLDLERIFAFKEIEKLKNISKVLFILHNLDGAGSLSAMSALKNALRLRREFNIQVFISTEIVRLIDPWTEKSYSACREAGVIFFKGSEFYKQIQENESGYLVQIQDAWLNKPDEPAIVDFQVDLLVFEPRYLPAAGLDVFWSPIAPDKDRRGFFQEENLHLAPVRSGREGIYVVGACINMKDSLRCQADAAVAASLIQLDREPTAEDLKGAEVEEGKCVACLTCVRLCPHHAIDCQRTAVVSKISCQQCGVCVTECPARAITLAGTEKEFHFDPKKSSDLVRIVAFCCEGSTYAAAQDALGYGPIADCQLELVKVHCSGNVDALDLMRAFEAGADGILVAACQPNNCKYLKGNFRAAQHVNISQEILNQLELDTGRLKFEHFASNMGREFRRSLEKFTQEIIQFGKSPLRVVSTTGNNR